MPRSCGYDLEGRWLGLEIPPPAPPELTAHQRLSPEKCHRRCGQLRLQDFQQPCDGMLLCVSPLVCAHMHACVSVLSCAHPPVYRPVPCVRSGHVCVRGLPSVGTKMRWLCAHIPDSSRGVCRFIPCMFP